jgi:tyrosinase
MRKISRRSFLAAGVAGAALDAIPFSVWIKDQAWAQGPRVRYSAYSTQGKAMLTKYQAAVTKMMNTSVTPEQNPLSWTFQWYTHFVKHPPDKTSELNRIYPTPSPQRTLAQAMWSTCRPHAGGSGDFFLPWHRMYVYYFELIVRQMSGDSSFTLPYWNYSNPAEAAIPPEFAVTTSSLYRSNRNPGVNTGSKIPANQVSLNVLTEQVYSPNGADQGFCANLNGGLHGNVHGWVGNGVGMGTVPWAANDPIFWMHHCNIDRLWASWNRGSCKNPGTSTWLNQPYTFADANGNQVVATVTDFKDIAPLGYTYDAFESASCRPIIKINPAVLAALAAEIKLANAPQRATLTPPPPPPAPRSRRAKRRPAATTTALSEKVKALEPARSVYLVLKNIRSDVAPGVPYDVYLDLPAGTQPNRDLPNYVGTFSFFGAAMLADSHAAMTPLNLSFDVTEQVKALAAKGELTPTPAVTIVPDGSAAAGANPTIGQVQLVSQ